MDPLCGAVPPRKQIPRFGRGRPRQKARFAKEQARLYEVHGKQNILHDPYYNPNLSLDYEDFRESGDLRNLKNVTL